MVGVRAEWGEMICKKKIKIFTYYTDKNEKRPYLYWRNGKTQNLDEKVNKKSRKIMISFSCHFSASFQLFF